MSASSAGAQASDAALAAQANQSTAYAKQAHDLLFGAGTGTGSGTGALSGGGGTLSKFLDPNSLNVSGPTGAYGLQYNKATENIANQGAQNRGAISRNLASRGFGNMPSGFAADQTRQEMADESNQKGAAFTDLAGKSYADALNNFWNSTNIASGSGAANTSAAISADSAAANNYANLYGTASTPKPNTAAALLGAGIQGGSQIGAAAACPCKGSMILMFDNSQKKIEDCKKGDRAMGIDGMPCEFEGDPEERESECVNVEGYAELIKSSVSEDHTFVLFDGGYDYASKSGGRGLIMGECDVRELCKVHVYSIGRQKIYTVPIGGSHSYRCDNLWALS